MVRNYFVRERMITKQNLLKFVNAHNGKDLKAVLALFSLKTGYRVDTLKTYVEELQDANLIKIKNGFIYGASKSKMP